MRLAGLAIKRGLIVANLDEIDLGLLMSFAVEGFLPAQDYSEASVNHVLKAWLARGGRMLRSDHVELRRTLIDLQFLSRDDFCRCYRLAASPPARFAGILGALSGQSLSEIVESARTAHENERAIRLEAYRQAQGTAPLSSR
jgi:hypothetical protein